MIRGLVAAALCAVAAWAFGAPDRGAELYEGARRAYRRLMEDGPQARKPPVWRETAHRFRKVAEEAPRSDKADDALYMVGLCFERAYALSAVPTDRRRSLGAYAAVARSYPASNLADDALLRAGRLLEARGDTAGAKHYYRRLLVEQPGGDMVPLARRRLQRLGKQTSVTRVRFWSGADYTRVVMDLTGPGPFEAKSLPDDSAAAKPHRIYLDFANAAIAPTCAACSVVSDGLVTQIRTGQHDPNTARVVLDLRGPATFRVFPLDAPARVVVDVFRSRPEADVVASIIGGAARPQPPPRKLRVVIDPGHGGKDPGAIGPRGLKEKDVTLAIARELAQVLRDRLDCQVRLTRDQDRYLSLEERTAVANAFGADLFVSIHANASRSSRARGIETYYLDRSSDRAARRLAARENASGEAALAEIEHILADVVLTSKIRDSRRLAEALQESMVSHLSQNYEAVRDLGVKRGPFYVLTGAVMPAVLVEASFITHPQEAKRLADPSYRRQTARALARGVERFVAGS